jgi:hypothetical protein
MATEAAWLKEKCVLTSTGLLIEGLDLEFDHVSSSFHTEWARNFPTLFLLTSPNTKPTLQALDGSPLIARDYQHTEIHPLERDGP